MLQSCWSVIVRAAELVMRKLRDLRWRGVLELLAAGVLVSVSTAMAAGFAAAPFIRLPTTDWGKVVLAPVVFGATLLMIGACVELAILFVYVRVLGHKDIQRRVSRPAPPSNGWLGG
jgi:hypothetical protein